MNYKETLFFVAKCLTITLEEKNRIEIEDSLKNTEIDWDSVVKVSTQHFVFPALYCNLKRVNLLQYLPEELVNYMVHITDLNRERNKQIIEQAKEINSLLLANDITPIFLKGTGNLLEGLYTDIAERMVGDIDFIVSKDNFNKAVSILKTDKYYSKNETYMDFHWHYPKMTKNGRIAAVEVHNKVLKKPYTSLLNYQALKNKSFKSEKCNVASFENQLLITILQKQINDNLYYSKSLALRNIYDSFLLANKTQDSLDLGISNSKIKKYLNNYKACAHLLLNEPKSLKYTKNSDAKKYVDSYLKTIENSKSELRKIKYIDSLVRLKDKLKILQYSFTDKEYSKYTFRRLKNLNFYLKQLNLTKSKSNS
ncbi:nucleotidyltransferase family protein [Polaribacter sp. KT 15]|uniref:nucleotidyltransferase family protein n=1 Tax=Polaribacter sp. KT 15 TaxID=1896175 RepID=UPI00090B32AC|nr:nucleotidyltransferase family protein [Polaribacter sp. KT 15]SHM78613.1 Uncharacterised nucleotidyltransferase [Polaribacter sp. KT 15]